jgi:ubiquitin-conjugating enzyme E2 C
MLTWVKSASPLNGEAAELWDKNAEEFKRKVLARHRDVDDD